MDPAAIAAGSIFCGFYFKSNSLNQNFKASIGSSLV